MSYFFIKIVKSEIKIKISNTKDENNNMTNKFNKEIFDLALAGDKSKLIAVPKADLHAHGLLSASFDRVKKIIPEMPLPPEKFNNFKEFIDYININYFPENDISAYEFKLYEQAILTMIDDGVVLTEMSFDLFSPSSSGISWVEYSRKLIDLRDKYSDKINLLPELGIHRATPKDFWLNELPKALSTGIFKSIDLYGDYSLGFVKDFVELFSIAKEAGLKIKYHSGELLMNDRMEQDLIEYKPNAIQHGITSIHNTDILKILTENEIMCNICVTSNLKLAGINNINEHPIRKMFDAGVKISLGTDDLSIFNSTLSEEYLKLYKNGIFTIDELETIRLNGFD